MRDLKIILFFWVATLWAGDFRNWDRFSGSNAFAYAQSFGSARQQALAGSGAALPSADLLGVLSNPMAVDILKSRHNAAVAWEIGALGKQQILASYALDLGFCPLQATIAWIDHDTQKGTAADANGEMVYTGKSYNPASQQWTLSSLIPTTHFKVGVALNVLVEQLSTDAGDQNGVGFGLDWGIRPAIPNLRWGWNLSLLDIGRQIRAYTQNGVDSLPLDTRLQAGAYYRPSWIRGMVFLGSIEAPRYSPALLRWGAEWSPTPAVALRAGTVAPLAELDANIRGEEYTGYSLDTWANVGAGLRLKAWNLDYAMSILREGQGLRQTMNIQVGW